VPFVNIPIIDQLVHPSIGLLSRVAVPGNPLAGPFISLAPPQNPVVALTYGIVLRINTVGAFHGRDVSSPVEYFDPPLGKIAVRYVDLSGGQIIRQVTSWTHDDQNFMWDEPLPTLWTLYMAPDVLADLFWLQT
jgi:hypothetical protein